MWYFVITGQMDLDTSLFQWRGFLELVATQCHVCVALGCLRCCWGVCTMWHPMLLWWCCGMPLWTCHRPICLYISYSHDTPLLSSYAGVDPPIPQTSPGNQGMCYFVLQLPNWPLGFILSSQCPDLNWVKGPDTSCFLRNTDQPKNFLVFLQLFFLRWFFFFPLMLLCLLWVSKNFSKFKSEELAALFCWVII